MECQALCLWHMAFQCGSTLVNVPLLRACTKELAWRSGSVMDCHATARGSIPGGYGVLTELHVLRKGQ